MSWDEFMTPPSEIELVHEFFADPPEKGHAGLDFDLASNTIAQHYVKARNYAVAPKPDTYNYKHFANPPGNRHVDGLTMPVHGNVWCNPPYSRNLIKDFTKRIVYISQHQPINAMLVLVNSQTDTGWYHELMAHADLTFFYRGRLKFWKMFNGEAHEKWEGEESKKRRTLDPNAKAKVGNSPRYLNTMFLFAPRENEHYIYKFEQLYGDRGETLIRF